MQPCKPDAVHAFPDLPARLGSLVRMCRVSGRVEVVHLREGSNANESPWYGFWQTLNPGKDSSADPDAPEPCARELAAVEVVVPEGRSGREEEDEHVLEEQCGLWRHRPQHI